MGYKQTYTYDVMGNLASQTSPTGATTTYKYNKQGFIEEEVAPNKAKTTYKYDREGNLTQVTYEDGTTEKYTYDKADRQVKATNRYGIKTQTTYNDMGLVSEVTESGRETGDRVTTYTYDEFGRIVREEQTGYHPITYEYDNKDRVTATVQGERKVTMTYDLLDRTLAQTDAVGTTIAYEYDTNGNVAKTTEKPKGVNDSEARVTTFVYDANNNLLETKLPDGSITKSTYDKDNRRITEIDANGKKTTYQYDKRGNVVSITDRSGKRSNYVYDGNGNVTAVTDANEVTTRYGYDIMGQVNRVEDAGGTTVYYEYDKSGNMTREITTDKNDNIEKLTGKSNRKVVDYYYDKVGNLIRVGAPTGEHEDYEYYKDGTLKRSISPSGKEISYTYDVAGNLTKTMYGKEVHAVKSYDGYGQMATMTDATGTTEYAYDDAGRVTRIGRGQLQLQYEYDVYGNVAKLTYPDQSCVSYEYDRLNRIATMTERSGVRVRYAYDKNSNLISEKRSDGIEKVNTYDIMDRMTSTKTTVNDRMLTSFRYKYDASGRMIEEASTDKIGSLVKYYGYDDCGKLVHYDEYINRTRKQKGEQSKDSPAQEKADKSIDYTYDLFGNRKKEVVTANNKVTQTTYEYDGSDRLKKKIVDGKTTGTYNYDKDGNLVSKEEDGKKTEYTYTLDNRIATVTVNGTLQQAVRYDGNGLKTFEILRKEYDATAVSEETKENNEKQLKAWTKYYEEEAETRTDETDDEGKQQETYTNLTLFSKRDYEEDAFYVASLVGSMAPPLWKEWSEFAAGFGEDVTETLRLLFRGDSDDVDDQVMIGETSEDCSFAFLLDSVKKPETVKTPYGIKVAYYDPTSYLYDLTQENPQVLAEYASPTTSKAKDAYDYGALGRTTSEASGVYVYDGRGSVSETVVKSKVTSTLRYDPYGEITTGAPTQDQIYGYNGEQYTPQTGLIYLRARNYDPTTGTFTSKDTYMGDKLEPVTRNRYTYGNNNPVSYQDPSGHKGVFARAVSAVKSTAKAAAKTVSKAVSTASRAVKSTAQAVTKTVQRAVTTVKQTTQRVVTAAKATVKHAVTTVAKTAQRVVNTAKTAVVNATRAVVNKAVGAVSTVVRNVKNAVGSAYQAAVNFYTDAKQCLAEAKETVSNYVTTKVKQVQAAAKQTWEETKDYAEQSLRILIQAKRSAAEAVQAVGEWWQGTDLAKNLHNVAESISSAYKNSIIGETVGAISSQINKAETALKEKWNNSPVGQFCNKAVTSAVKFYEDHKTAINFIVGTVIIGALVVATVVTGGAASCGLMYAISSGALKGAIIGAATGAAGGAFNGAMEYMEEHDTLDGSGSKILESASTGYMAGAASGAVAGGKAGAMDYAKHPGKYCFIAGTLVFTAAGCIAIENLQPGDMVYAMESVGDEQDVDVEQELDLKAVLETYAHEVDETYVITIDGDEVETTENHLFYDQDGNAVPAQELQAGDELATAEGDTATVDDVECVHHDEPVMVYNICVADDHTYFVGDHSVLVHNMCAPKKGNAGDISYERPSGFRKGIKDSVWENAKNADGDVLDPLTNKIMDKSEPWDMGHKPGYEFRKHQQSAKRRGISRKQFLDEYNNAKHYRPELPSSNRSHLAEDLTDSYFGD